MGQMNFRVAVFTSLALSAYAAAQTPCPQLHTDDSIQVRVQSMASERAAAGAGKTALFAMQPSTGKTAAIDADLPVQTASVIKLAILYEAMIRVRQGSAHWDEKIVLKPGEPVGGSGMLHFFDTPLTLTLKDILTMMVIVSDNTATNLMIDRFGVDAVNARMESLGLNNTHLYKKVFKPATGPMPADQPKFGLGKTTPREMATLMSYIGECRLQSATAKTTGFHVTDDADRAVCDVALTMLKSQFYRETVPRYLQGGGDQTVASKTGSLDAVRNDIAIVAGKSGPMVLAIFTYDNADHGWTVDNEGEMAIARLAKAIVEAWAPGGLDPNLLVPGFGAGGCPAPAAPH
jgi:beta-lactamase class A